MIGTYAPGALSVVALGLSAGYLWHLLGDVPAARRLGNLLLPGSQLLGVVTVHLAAPAYDSGLVAMWVSAAIGVLCALCDLPLYRALLDAEELERERARTRILTQQVEVQRRALDDARAAAAEGAIIRERLIRELAEVEGALGRDDPDAVDEHLAGADRVLALPRAHVCQHPAADAILRAKLDEAERAGVRVTCSARLPFDMPTPAAELCAVIANAWDNAIDACRTLPAGERWIEFAAREAHGFVSVDMRNSCRADAGPKESGRPRGPRGAAGSLPMHGWGLSIIERVAARHAGSVEYGREGAVFCLSAVWELDREGEMNHASM